MSIKIECHVCSRELDRDGALIFSPPNGLTTGKYHVCIRCWRKLSEWLFTGIFPNCQERQEDLLNEVRQIRYGLHRCGGDYGGDCGSIGNAGMFVIQETHNDTTTGE